MEEYIAFPYDIIIDYSNKKVLRKNILKANLKKGFGEYSVDVLDEKNKYHTYTLLYRIEHEGKVYCLLGENAHMYAPGSVIPMEVFTYEKADNPNQDKLIKIKDPALNDKMKHMLFDALGNAYLSKK